MPELRETAFSCNCCRTAKQMMARHGTDAMLLTPGSIIETARQDIRRRARNQVGEGIERYAFRAQHVRRAKSVEHLILLTLKLVRSPGFMASPQKISLILMGRNIPALEEARRQCQS